MRITGNRDLRLVSATEWVHMHEHPRVESAICAKVSSATETSTTRKGSGLRKSELVGTTEKLDVTVDSQ